MSEINLKDYLLRKGFNLSWVAKQVGMSRENFFLCAKNGYAFDKDVACFLQDLTQRAWIAVATDREEKMKMEINL